MPDASLAERPASGGACCVQTAGGALMNPSKPDETRTFAHGKIAAARVTGAKESLENLVDELEPYYGDLECGGPDVAFLERIRQSVQREGG